MRIALVHYTAPPVIGGVERVLAEQARQLASRGHDVRIVCGNADAVAPGAEVVVAPELARAATEPGHSCPAAAELEPSSDGSLRGTGASPDPCGQESPGSLRVALSDCDAVMVHNVFTMPFNVAVTAQLHRLAAELKHIHWINWVHDVAAVNPYYSHLPWGSEEFAILKSAPPCAHHVAVSEVRRQDFCRATGVSVDRCRVIPNGVDVNAVLGLTPRIAALAEARGFWRRDLVLLQPARLLRRKNIELGIRLMAELPKLGWNALFATTGAPDSHQVDSKTYFEEMKALASCLGVEDSVVFAGEDGILSDDDVRSLYEAADALLFPSQGEGFGLPLLEAALHRLPVFCADIAVHREVAGPGAIRFPLNAGMDEVAKLIKRRMGDDASRLERRRIDSQFSWHRICEDFLEPLLAER